MSGGAVLVMDSILDLEDHELLSALPYVLEAVSQHDLLLFDSGSPKHAATLDDWLGRVDAFLGMKHEEYLAAGVRLLHVTQASVSSSALLKCVDPWVKTLTSVASRNPELFPQIMATKTALLIRCYHFLEPRQKVKNLMGNHVKALSSRLASLQGGKGCVPLLQTLTLIAFSLGGYAKTFSNAMHNAAVGCLDSANLDTRRSAAECLAFVEMCKLKPGQSQQPSSSSSSNSTQQQPWLGTFSQALRCLESLVQDFTDFESKNTGKKTKNSSSSSSPSLLPRLSVRKNVKTDAVCKIRARFSGVSMLVGQLLRALSSADARPSLGHGAASQDTVVAVESIHSTQKHKGIQSISIPCDEVVSLAEAILAIEFSENELTSFNGQLITARAMFSILPGIQSSMLSILAQLGANAKNALLPLSARINVLLLNFARKISITDNQISSKGGLNKQQRSARATALGINVDVKAALYNCVQALVSDAPGLAAGCAVHVLPQLVCIREVVCVCTCECCVDAVTSTIAATYLIHPHNTHIRTCAKVPYLLSDAQGIVRVVAQQQQLGRTVTGIIAQGGASGNGGR